MKLRRVSTTYLGRPWILDPSANDETLQRLARDMGDRDHDVASWIGEGRDVLSLRFGELSDEFRVVLVSKKDADLGRAPSGYYLILVDLNTSHARRLYGPYATDVEARHAAAREVADDDTPEIFSGKSPRQTVVDGFRPLKSGRTANRSLGRDAFRLRTVDGDSWQLTEVEPGRFQLSSWERSLDRWSPHGYPRSLEQVAFVLAGVVDFDRWDFRAKTLMKHWLPGEFRHRVIEETGANKAKGRSKLVEDAVEAARLYHGSSGASVRDQQRLRSRLQKKVDAVARKYGGGMDPSLAVSTAMQDIVREAHARGPRTPMPGKDY